MRFTIVITGVTKGLGRALAEQYIHLNHTVIGCGRNIETITEMKSGVSRAKRAPPIFYLIRTFIHFHYANF